MYEYTLTRWLDQLGLLALSGQRVQCRQTLVSRHTLARPCLDPNPNPNPNATPTPTPTPTPNPNPNPNQLGSDYGLIDATSLEGTPDFWASYSEPEPPNPDPDPDPNPNPKPDPNQASVLWKRLMGPHVLAVSAAGAPRPLRLHLP